MAISFKVVVVFYLTIRSCQCICVEDIAGKVLTCEKLDSMDLRSVHTIKDLTKYTSISIKNSEFLYLNSSDIWKDFKNLVEINITHSNINTVPDDLFAINNKIATLNLGNNEIQNVTDDSKKYLHAKKLITMDMAHNKISTFVCATFKNLTLLENLVLSWNQIAAIDKTAFNCLANLKTLYLDYNGLRTIADNSFENLKKLRVLVLHNNNLTKVSGTTFFGVRDLRHLHLSNNQILTINSNALDSIPYLKNFYCSNNNIQFLDSQLFTGKTYLLSIWLNRNNIQLLPTNFFKTTGSLELLHLGYNNLSHLEEHTFRGLTKLKTLFVDHNIIDFVHPNALNDLVNIKHLDFSYNRVQNITTGMLQKLENVHFMKFDHNNITAVETLPELKNLIILDISYNSIDAFFSFHECVQLSELNLQYNKISEIVVDEVKLVNKIDLTGNPISQRSLEEISNSPYSFIFKLQDLSIISDVTDVSIGLNSADDRCSATNTMSNKLNVVANDSHAVNQDASYGDVLDAHQRRLLRICLMTVVAVVLTAVVVVLAQWYMLKKHLHKLNVARNQEDFSKNSEGIGLVC